MISTKQKADLANDLRVLGLILNADLTKEVIAAYVKLLECYEINSAKRAISWATKNCKFFPKPVELIEFINPTPKKEDADYHAGLAIQCITRFGIYRAEEAKNFMGSKAWSAVLNVGGWQVLCNTPPNTLGSLRAQLRDNCFAVISSDNIKDREQRRLDYKNKNLIGSNLFKLIGENDE